MGKLQAFWIVMFALTVTAFSQKPPAVSPKPAPAGKPHKAQHSPAPKPPENSTSTSPKAAPAPLKSHSGPSPAPSPGPSAAPVRPVNNGTLDPSQISALEALKVPVPSNPCAGSHSTMICDEGSPVRRLIFLQLQYCPLDAVLSEPALRNLSGLQALSFSECPMKPSVELPTALTDSLTSFSCVSSLGRASGFEELPPLPGTWLSKLHHVQDLTIMDVVLNTTSSLSSILSNMTDLHELKISNASLKGMLPKSFPTNISSIELSLNALQGQLPVLELDQLQNLDLTGNNLTGHLPDSLGRLRSLQRLALSSNRLSGTIPAKAISNMSLLTYLDLSNNMFNGTVPVALSELVGLRYLDLRNNEFKGVLPFNSSFLTRLNNFRASGNTELCYNSTVVPVSRLVNGLPPCDNSGKPITSGSAGPATAPGEGISPVAEPEQGHKRSKKKGPKTIVWAVATALGAIFLFIALVVVFSKWCRWKEA